VILSTSVLKIIDIAKRISRFLPKGAILTDTGSTKKDVVNLIESILPKAVNFVGSHPLAGSEKSGLGYADKDLFKSAYCILTKTNRTSLKAMNRLKRFWKILEMKVEIMDPVRHDRVISRLSHLPHAVAVGLSNTVAGTKDSYLAAGGFRDTTRIASGSPELWKDIFITNRDNIAQDIKVLKSELSKIEKALNKKDKHDLLRLFKKAKAARDTI